MMPNFIFYTQSLSRSHLFNPAMAATIATTTENKHVAVFTFPSSGHVATLLNLVLKLSHATPHVTFSFFITPKFNQFLLSKPGIPANVKIYAVSDGVPDGHTLSGRPEEEVNFFLQAGPQNLQKGIESAVSDTRRNITSIISDAFSASSLLVARELNVPWIALWVANPCSLSAHYYTDIIRQRHAKISVNGEKERNLSFIPGMSKFLIDDLPDDVTRGGDKKSHFLETLGSMGKILPQADAVLMNFYEELSPPSLLEDIKSKLQSVLHVGFLSLALAPPPPETDNSGCLSWLDGHGSRSVAFVSFGTVMVPPPEELTAIAEALEASGIPFLWSLKENFQKFLPNEFLERTKEHGKVLPWVPQAQVLAHESVGVYITHCGLNSVSESIFNEVPMICRPLIGDNWINARMVEDEWEIGVRVENGVFSKNGLINGLKMVLIKEPGKKMRKKILELKKVLVDAAGPEGKAAKDFDSLVELISGSG